MKSQFLITLLLGSVCAADSALTEQQLVLKIAHVCELSNKKIKSSDKIDCIEFFVNCAVAPGGIIKSDKVEQCIKQYNNITPTRGT